MKRSSLLFLLGVLALAFACNHVPQNSTKAEARLTANATLELPKLLDRPEALRYGKEWDNVQNIYGAQCAELRRDPNNADAKLKLAELFIEEARITGEHPHYYPAALNLLDNTLAQLGDVGQTTDIHLKDMIFRALSHKASVELSQHDFGHARETALKAVALNPYNAYIYGCLVDANVELGDYKTAVAMADKMVSIRPDLRSYSRVSYLREIHGDPKGAMEAMALAVQAGYPGYEQTEWARLQLGHLHERYGKLADADAIFHNCLTYRENYPFAQAALAGLAIRNGQFGEAEKGLNEAILTIPEVSFYLQLASVYQKTGRSEDLKKLLPKIEAMFTQDRAAGHHTALEEARFNMDLTGNLAKAEKLALEEYAARPENIEVNKVLFQVYTKIGDKTKQAFHLKKARATGSKDPELN